MSSSSLPSSFLPQQHYHSQLIEALFMLLPLTHPLTRLETRFPRTPNYYYDLLGNKRRRSDEESSRQCEDGGRRFPRTSQGGGGCNSLFNLRIYLLSGLPNTLICIRRNVVEGFNPTTMSVCCPFPPHPP